MAERMINIVGIDSVHHSVRSSKLRATMWAGPVNFSVGKGQRILRRTMLDGGSLVSSVRNA